MQVEFETKPCPLCGNTSKIMVDRVALQSFQAGAFAQEVWPNWAGDQRELMITGTHPDCWDKIFEEEEGE
jgi:hypothetical protein